MAANRAFLHSGRAETALAMIGHAGSSAYWLALAFALSAHAYGELMTIQAAVLMVIGAVTFRTYDLFFHLISYRGHQPEDAYGIARLCEIGSCTVATLVGTAGAAIVFMPSGDAVSAASTAGFAFLASVGANQGATVARLRQHERSDLIARIDAATAAAWGLACLAILPLRQAPAATALMVGGMPPFLRTLALALATRGLSDRSPKARAVLARTEAKAVARFLAGAQLSNFVKNAGVSIETLILAAFASPAVVAMYRVARGALGVAMAALNVAYQRIYPILARATTALEKTRAVDSLRRRSIMICVAIYPLSAALALVYSFLKPEVGVLQLQLVTLALLVAMLPSALQQGAFATLSVRGDHRSVGVAYAIGFAALLVGSLPLMLWPRLEIFILAVIGSSMARLAYLSNRTRLQAAPRATHEANVS